MKFVIEALFFVFKQLQYFDFTKNSNGQVAKPDHFLLYILSKSKFPQKILTNTYQILIFRQIKIYLNT
jgi:hypothetical protein